MCGIAGFVLPNHEESCRLLLKRMIGSIRHRGPDDEGLYCNELVGLAACRLSVIDLSPMGHQPMTNEDGSLWLAYNGEIYNFSELRKDLTSRGHRFRSEADTEVVLHAYEEYGIDCLEKFNGMYAFALWDAGRRRLFCARDRMGIKPFYYYESAGRFVFSSEIKAILQDSNVPREINPVGLNNYLSFGHAIAPQTIYKGIQKLLPGHYLLLEEGNLSDHVYWDLGKITPESLRSLEEYAQEVKELLRDSVRLQMVSDVPVGVFLSGGLDSSAVVAFASQIASRPVKTFSVGFEGGSHNELPDAQIVARHFETEHHELLISQQDIIPVLEKLAWHFDEPFADTAAIPVYLLSQYARRSVTVVLTGEGGDEIFGGYRRYVAEQYSHLFQKLPPICRRLAETGTEYLPRLRRTKKLLRTMSIVDPAERYAGWLLMFERNMMRSLLQPDVYESLRNTDPYAAFRENYSMSDMLVNRMLKVDAKTWLPDTYLEKMDKATMANSLEGRVPLLDHRLVELAFRLPPQMKVGKDRMKIILRQAMSGVLPKSTLNKRKRGFTAPTDRWFRTGLKEFVRSVLCDGVLQRTGLFNMSFIDEMLRSHSEGKEVWDWPLFSLMAFALWHHAFMETNPSELAQTMAVAI